MDHRNILSIRIIIRLCILAFLAGTTVGIWYFLPYFILDLKGGLIEVGLASTVPGLIAAFVQLSVGMILDETEASQDILVLGFILSALCTFPILIISNVWMAILWAAVMETFNSLTIIWGVANSMYMASLIPAEKRARIMSINSSSWYVGNVAGSLIAGYLASVNWSFVFIVFSIVNLIAGIFLKYALPPSSNCQKGYWTILRALMQVDRVVLTLKRIPRLLQHSSKAYTSFLSALSIRSVGISMVLPLVAVYLAEGLQASKPAIAALTSIGTIARIVLSPIVGWTADRVGRKTIFLLGLTMMIVYPILHIATPDVGLLYPTYLIIGLGWACNQATFLAWMMELIPPPQGMFMGLLNFLNNLAWAIGPSIGGALGEYAGIWWGIGFAVFAELIGFILLIRVPERASIKK